MQYCQNCTIVVRFAQQLVQIQPSWRDSKKGSRVSLVQGFKSQHLTKLHESFQLRMVASSYDRGWMDLNCALSLGRINGWAHWNSPNVFLSILISGNATIEWKQHSVVRTRSWTSGNCCLFSAHQTHLVHCEGSILVLNVCIEPCHLREFMVFRTGCIHDECPVSTSVAFEDADLTHLAELLHADLISASPANPAQQSLLTNALSDYLWRRSELVRTCPVCFRSCRSTPDCSRRNTIRQMMQAISIMTTRFADQELVNGVIAAEIGMDPFQFCRAFHSSMRTSPHQFLIGQRVNHAMHLLSSTHHSAAEIALDCGFSSQSHLSSTFRRVLHTTPASYRRNTQTPSVRNRGTG